MDDGKNKRAKYDTLVATWNNLQHRISRSHIRRRPVHEVNLSLVKEFRRLVRNLYLNKVNPAGYKIIKFDTCDLSAGYVTLRSLDGFIVRIYLSDLDMFSSWAFSEDCDKEDEMKKRLKIGNRVYDTYGAEEWHG